MAVAMHAAACISMPVPTSYSSGARTGQKPIYRLMVKAKQRPACGAGVSEVRRPSC